MLFLVKAIDYTSSEGVWGTILQAARALFYNISELIYKFISILCNLFNDLSSVRLLDSEMFGVIASRVGTLLGIIMLFIVLLDFMKLLLEPDKINDKEIGMGSIITRILVVIVMLGVSNFFFDALYAVQDFIIDEGLIYKIILPSEKDENIKLDIDNFGNKLSGRTFAAFYSINENLISDDTLSDEDKGVLEDCIGYVKKLDYEITKSGNYTYGSYCLNAVVGVSSNVSDEIDTVFVVDYNFVLQLLVGGLLCYILVNYVVKVGVRAIQLAVLQIFSPVAIIGYLSPKKDNIFSKWWKVYISTYIDLFIRVGIIYLMIYLSLLLLESKSYDTFWDTVGKTSNKVYIIIAMVLALLTFAKKAPDLIKGLLPNAGESKLGFGASWKDIVGLQKGFKIGTSVLGGVAGGAAVGLLGGGLGGFAGGLLKGGVSGLKGQGLVKTATGAWKAGSKANQNIANVRANGGSWGGYQMAQLQKGLGLQTEADFFNLEKSDLETENAAYKSYDSYFDAAEKRAEGQILKGKFDSDIARRALQLKSLAEIYRQQSSTIKKSDFYDRDSLVTYAANNLGIKRGNYSSSAAYEEKLNEIAQSADFNDYVDSRYKATLDELATKASKTDSDYLAAIKAAKSEYISKILSGEEKDDPTLQNLQQAAGIIEANSNNSDYNFVLTKDADGNDIDPVRVTAADLLAGNYDTFDNVNANAKAKQAENNNRLARNKTEGAGARANAGK